MRERSKSLRRIIFYVVVAAFVIIAGFPVYWMLTTAFGAQSDLYSGNQTPYPQLGNIGLLLESLADLPLARWMSNSFLIAGGTTIVSLCLGTLAGYALSRFRFVGRGLVSGAMLVTQVLPEALILIPLYGIFVTLGLLNSLWGLVIANAGFALPVAAFIIMSAVDGVPVELEEAARIDNCPRLSILTSIIVPVISPSIAAAAVITFFSAWNEYLLAATFLLDQERWPASVGLASFIGQYETPLAGVMGAALLFCIPAIVFFLIVQRRIVAGLTTGAVKG
ncbi:carbohydrate ABC transporter permease [Pseudactinotalea sp. HY158]|uniref:carbohydrate ABC transporter permease n=1 Tax=Pseudactinotalea sp. HY158 TaxID=2654547 RepID=UPI00129CDAA5|nr:carbohydrate ABC transporter permease [Pseudactinotalea sp. HY158]QGH68459.1 ABC transporter permease subunit [Pseudactinotalea sp. HY158]